MWRYVKGEDERKKLKRAYLTNEIGEKPKGSIVLEVKVKPDCLRVNGTGKKGALD